MSACVAVSAWQVPAVLAVCLAVLCGVDLIRARARVAPALAAGGSVVLALAILASSGPQPPTLALPALARVLSTVALAAWVHARRPATGDPRGPATAALVCVLALVVRFGLWSAGQDPVFDTPTRMEPRWVEGARLGFRQRVAAALRDHACEAFARGERREAVQTLSWGGVLAPGTLSGAEALLWKVSFIAPGDPAQARRLALGVLRDHTPAQVISALRPRPRTLVLQLAEWSEVLRRPELTEALVREALRPSSGGALTSCPQPSEAQPPGEPRPAAM
ncbi:MAG: hypothetical protein ABIJ09_21625 [Pseudomonadota bacterium]